MPPGWFDADHLLFMHGQPLNQASVLEVAGNSVTPISMPSNVIGRADPVAPFFVPIPSNIG